MSDSRRPPSNPLPAENHNNLELAKEAAHDYASENCFATALLRSAKWGHPRCVRKVWMRCAQGGLHRILSSEEPDLRKRLAKLVGCAYVFVLVSKHGKWTMTPDTRCSTAP